MQYIVNNNISVRMRMILLLLLNGKISKRLKKKLIEKKKTIYIS